jgi:protein TonB
MMEHLIESESRGISGRSVMTKLLSAGIEVGVIALLIVIPLLATDGMPEPPDVMMTFMAPPPPPPPPPTPPPASRAPQPVEAAKAAIPKILPASDFVAPVEMPTEIPVEEFGIDAALLAGAVESGVPGSAFGGVDGGMPGAPVAEPIRIGGEIQPPRKVADVRPDYPITARNARVEGTVILEAVIDARGIVADVRVLKSIPLLDEAAIEAVKKWRYQATLLNGEAVPVVMTVTVNFGLDKA